jgi:hypothetical protein
VTEKEQGLSAEELEAQRGEELPDREAMSLLLPGASFGTPAADDIPLMAQTWHGQPDEPHIM